MTTYYHWAYQMPIPRPFGNFKSKVVFLTKTPAAVYHNHGREGNLYAFDVPPSVEKARKPHWYDGAQQIAITEELWPQVKFLGRVKDSKVEQIINHPFYTNSRSHENPVPKPYMAGRNFDKTLLEKSEEQLALLEKIESRVTKAFPVVRFLLEREKSEKSPAKEYLRKIPYIIGRTGDSFFQGNHKIIFRVLLEAVQNKKAILEGGKIKGSLNKALEWMLKNTTTTDIFYFLTVLISDRKRILNDTIRREKRKLLSPEERLNFDRKESWEKLRQQMNEKLRERREKTK